MIRMTGCLTISRLLYTMNDFVDKDGKSQQLWCELTAGILRCYEMVNGKKKEEGDGRCIDALDTQEFNVFPIMKNNQLTDSFKVLFCFLDLMISWWEQFVRLFFKQNLFKCVKSGFLYFKQKNYKLIVCFHQDFFHRQIFFIDGEFIQQHLP